MNWQNKSYTVSNADVERKTALTLQSQPSANLSVKMHLDMPTQLVSEKTVPSRRSAAYHIDMSSAER